jgi:hypothetical protein
MTEPAVSSGWAPSLASRDANHLDTFITGNNGHVYTTWWNSSLPNWGSLIGGGGWEDIGSTFPVGAPVSVAARDANHLDIFITGNDGHVYTTWWNSSLPAWASVTGGGRWKDIGGTFPVGAPVTVVARDANHLDIFITGNDGHVYTTWWNSGLPDWASVTGGGRWKDIGGTFPVGAPVSVVARDASHLDIFITGNDGHVYTTWWNSRLPDWASVTGGGRWKDIGGTFPVGAPVSVVARDANHLDSFITGNDGHVYTTWWNSSLPDWASVTGGGRWKDIGGTFPTAVPSVALYRFSLDSFEIRNTRSRHEDTDYVAFTVMVGNGPPQTLQKAMGNLNNGTFSVGLPIGPVPIAAYQPAVVNYLILNSGHQSQADIEATLTKVANSLAGAGAQAAASAIGAGVGTLVGASIGGVVVPIIGSALGALAGWLVGEVTGVLFANCDGPVAAQQVPFTGTDLWRKTSAGGDAQPVVFRTSTDNPGIDSPVGCGSNSDYVVNWSVARS